MVMAQALSIEPAMVVSVRPDLRELLRSAFESCADGLRRYILVRVGGDGHVADELLQSCCHVAARRRRLPATRDECERFLFGIARNLLREHRRRQKRARRQLSMEHPALAVDMESQPLPAEALERVELRQQLLLAITALSAAEQQLLFDFYFESRSQAEIAVFLGVSVKSVETRLYRARQHLRARLRHLTKE